MNSWTAEVGLWLVDFYLLSTLLLAALLASMFVVRQPARRLAVVWGALAGLAILAVVCSLPGWPRLHLIATTDAQFLAATALSPVGNRRINSLAVAGADAKPSRKSVDGMGRAPRSDTSAIPRSVPPIVPITVGFPIGSATVPMLQQLGTTVFYGFIAGFVCVAVWLISGALQTMLLLRKATVAPAHFKAALARIVGQGPACPRLLLSPRIDSPVAIGIRRPTILLPVRFVEHESWGSLRALLAHEWAHIRNKDLWLLGVNRCLLLLLFAHPLYWWLRGKIRNDQELLADASAAGDMNCEDYAAQLLAWARKSAGRISSRVPAAVGVWERPSALSQRIERLLNDRLPIEIECSPLWRRTAVVMLVAFTLLLSFVTARPGTPSLHAAGQAPEKEPADKAPPDESAAILKVLAKLSKEAEFSFSETRFSEAMQLIAKQQGLSMVVDSLALQKQGIEPDVRISYQQSGLTLRSALALILEPLELGWEIADDGIRITTPEQTSEPVLSAAYLIDEPVRKVFEGKDPQKAKMEFQKAVLSTIEPKSWKNAGGRGSASWGRRGFVVVNTSSVHQQIRALSSFLKHGLMFEEKFARSFALKSTIARRRIEEALKEQADYSFVATPLSAALEYMQQYHDGNIVMDKKAFRDAGVELDTPFSFEARGSSFSRALDQILEPLGLDYAIQHEVLKITSPEKAAAMLETRIYNVKQLVAKNVEADVVIRHVVGTVMPESWSNAGGPAKLAHLPGCLLVYQTQRAHGDIPEQLKELKQRLHQKVEEGR